MRPRFPPQAAAPPADGVLSRTRIGCGRGRWCMVVSVGRGEAGLGGSAGGSGRSGDVALRRVRDGRGQCGAAGLARLGWLTRRITSNPLVSAAGYPVIEVDFLQCRTPRDHPRKRPESLHPSFRGPGPCELVRPPERAADDPARDHGRPSALHPGLPAATACGIRGKRTTQRSRAR